MDALWQVSLTPVFNVSRFGARAGRRVNLNKYEGIFPFLASTGELIIYKTLVNSLYAWVSHSQNNADTHFNYLGTKIVI